MTSASTSSIPSPDSQNQGLIVGAGFTLEGQVHGQGAVIVHGSIKGHVRADSVVIAASAHVVGHIECKQLDIAGRLDGSFGVDDAVVRAGGVVITNAQAISRGTLVLAGACSGQLQAHQLKVDATGQLSGQTYASQMDVSGHVQGEVDVGDMVVRSQGTVDGKLVYGNLSMERGSDVSGQIQRKDRETATVAAKVEDSVVLHLPLAIVQRLRQHPDDLRLSLADGQPLPSWISVDREHAWLVLGKREFDRLQAQGQSLMVRMQAGEENLVFKLPPDAE